MYQPLARPPRNSLFPRASHCGRRPALIKVRTMRMELEPSLNRWVEAQLLDLQQADRIRQFESEQSPSGARAGP